MALYWKSSEGGCKNCGSLVSDVKILVVIDALAIQVVCVKNVSRGK